MALNLHLPISTHGVWKPFEDGNFDNEEVAMTTRKVLKSREEPAFARELSQNEIDQVSGGIGPLIAAIVSVAMSTTARGLAGAFISRGAAIYAVYSAASYYRGRGGGGGGIRRGRSICNPH